VADFLRMNWGNLASVLALGVSVWVLVVADKAKNAAEGARALARKRSLIEELNETNTRMQPVGLWVRDQKWEIVQLRTQELLGSCKSVLSRWFDNLMGVSANDLRTVCTLLLSIASLAGEASLRQLDEQERRQMLDAQLRAGELISDALGRSHRSEERS
jgi:hypothetical protein